MFDSHRSTLQESQKFIKDTSELLAKTYLETSCRAMHEKWDDICSKNLICGMDKTIISDRTWVIIFSKEKK